MRLREVRFLLIAPLGLAAALTAHVLIQALANLGVGAASFTAHEHTAVEPAAFVEGALALWWTALAVRDALTIRARSYYSVPTRPARCTGHLACCSALIALVAIATLFGMEYVESGSAALGLGWLGGDFVHGASALVAAIVAAVGTLYLVIRGHLAGFDRLVALLAAALARLAATLLGPAPVPQRVAARRLAAHPAPVARHAGLRAPPLTTR